MNIQKVIVIAIGWLFIGIFLSFYNEALLSSPFFSNGQAKTYDFYTHLFINSLISLSGGVIGGTILVLINSRLFREKSFRFALFTTTFSYVLLYLFLLVVFTTIRVKIELGSDATFTEALNLSWRMLQNLTVISNFALWGIVTLFTLFLLQVNDKFGPGKLGKFLMGKYYHAKKEERIFMFLDMKSSTTIAEQIGNEKYFSLLSNLFSHLTDPILNSDGEIYQYVGDEIVISWPLKKGIKNANCIKCFFKIRDKLELLEDYYKKTYDTIPTFKAGLHHGSVMAGEIGIIKKDIIYSGDVLNTAARIQSKCNEHKVDFLVSQDTLNLINNKNKNQFITTPIGSIELRGKKQKLNLIAINVH